MSKERSQERVLVLNDGYQLEYTVVRLESSPKPLLLFIVGSSGLGAFYRNLAVYLSKDFICVYYDRRGFRSTRSKLPEGDDTDTEPSTVITRHAKDAAELITHLTHTQLQTHSDGGQPGAFVFATSFGATIALCLLLFCPKLIRKAVLHEPMLPTLLPAGHERDRYLTGFRAVGNAKAPFTVFSECFLSPREDASATHTLHVTPSKVVTSKENDFWSSGSSKNLKQARSEGLAVTCYYPDPTQLATIAASGKLALIVGRESTKSPIYAMSQALARTAISLPGAVQDIEGGHFTFASRKYAEPVSVQVRSILWDSSLDNRSNSITGKKAKI